MILEILFSILLLYSIFVSYLCIVTMRRINQYEGFILKFQQIIEIGTQKMKNVDATGHYESDDETGFFFEQMKEIQLILDSIIETEKISKKEK